jgi:hypothetical protein
MPQKKSAVSALAALPAPTPWPGANARLLGIGAGLPVNALDRLAMFSADDFERFTLEWATGYLQKQAHVKEVQWRGGAGDKGRDVIVWLDTSDTEPRRWELYQCKRYDANLGFPKAGIEIAKILYYTFNGDYTAPENYYFVTHKRLTSSFQDLLDAPKKLMDAVIAAWDGYADAITSKKTIELTPELRKHVEAFNFSIFKAKQPHDLIKEHAQTEYHLVVFGAPLIDRPDPPEPPSVVATTEARYIEQLYAVIGSHLKADVKGVPDFMHSSYHSALFTRSRLTFYSAEGLFELARDQFASTALFDSLLGEFGNGLFFSYTEPSDEPMARLKKTVQAAQSLQLGAQPLAAHMNTNDREGMCHQMANKDVVNWCAYD